VVRRDRDRHGGGVCAYIRSGLAFNERSDLHNTNLEISWVEILLPKTKPILIGSCYRPPKQSDFLELLENVLINVRSDIEWYLLGDFNICVKQKGSCLFKKLQELLSIFDLKQIIEVPTRITPMSSSVLDLIICSYSSKVSQHGTLPVGLGDHLPVFMTRKSVKGQVNGKNYMTIRSLKHYSPENFILKLQSADWSSIFTAESVNSAWIHFRNIFNNILNSVAPVKEVRLKQRSEPWLSSDILSLIKERDLSLFKFRKYNNKEDYSKYCSLRNIVQRNIKQAKADYIYNQIEENKNDPKKLWQQLKDLGHSKKVKSSPKVILKIGNETCFDAKTIANHFNGFLPLLPQFWLESYQLVLKYLM
jgi:hypothetical protein